MRTCSTRHRMSHPEWWITPAVILRFSFLSFVRNRDLHTAATLAFYGVLAMIPLCLAVLFLLSLVFVSSRQVSRAVETLIIQIVPHYYEVILREVFALAEQGVIGIFGLIPLLGSVVPLVSAIRAGFIHVFKADRTAGFIHDKLLDVLTVLFFLLLFLGFGAGQILYDSVMGDAMTLNGISGRLENVLPLLTGTLFLSLFFLVFSPVRLEWWNLLLSAAFTALLWSIVRPLFVTFLRFNPDHGIAFGSLKAVLVLVVWIYYSFAVILFGTELLANIRRREALMLSRLFESKTDDAGSCPPVPSRFVRSCEPGDVIFEEDSPGREMFYILSGAVHIVRKGQLLREMTAGNYFGEMAALIQAPRTAAAVTAAPDTKLVVISQSNLETILRENPRIVVSFLKEMTGRLRALNEKMDGLPEDCRVWNG